MPASNKIFHPLTCNAPQGAPEQFLHPPPKHTDFPKSKRKGTILKHRAVIGHCWSIASPGGYSTSCCASSNFFFLLSGMRSSSQLSSRLVKKKSNSLRMKTKAKTCEKTHKTYIHLVNSPTNELWDIRILYKQTPQTSYHHGKNDGSSGGFNDPQKHQAAELDDGEQVDLSQRDVSQVNKVRLVFRRHPKQPQTIKELTVENKYISNTANVCKKKLFFLYTAVQKNQVNIPNFYF